jgi:uncharacterized phage-associated protein
MYKAMDVAKWFIQEGIKNNKPFTPMQIIKLCYIAQGVHLAIYNQPLFMNSVEAWKYGPVIKAVYQNLRVFGKERINETAFLDEFRGINPADVDTEKVLKAVLDKFGKMDGLALSAWTHRPGSAWDKAYNLQGGYKYLGYDIDPDLLKEEFSQIAIKKRTRDTIPGWW